MGNYFETQMEGLNFVLGKFVLVASTNLTQLVCSDEAEMLKHAQEYNAKMNRGWKFFIFNLIPSPIISVLHKEENSAQKKITYIFQKDSGTVIKLTVALV
jgi:hypothetical protein